MKVRIADTKTLNLIIRALEVYRDYVEWKLDWNNKEPFRPKERVEIEDTTYEKTERLIKEISTLEELKLG